ncbi:MAG: hypothetical protein KDC48_17395 [Planctomycetes bacterium]|nr:hypothetical protein [Planctomycetota bacterium]
MNIMLRLAAAATATAASLLAQSATITVPTLAPGVPGNSSNSFPWGTSASGWAGLRLQAVYDSANFPGVTGTVVITRLRWFANDQATTTTWVGGTFANASVYMSTAAVDYGAVTTNFSGNHGFDLQTVYSGAVTYLAGSGNGVGVPGPAVVDLTLTTPFYYNPANGDLCIDVDYPGGANFTAAGAGTSLVSMDVQSTGSMSSRVFASSMYPTANGTTQNHGPVVEITYSKIIEVNSPLVPMSLVDMDAVGSAGPTSVAALNAGGSPVPATIRNITLTPSTAGNPGVYNTNPTEGRALALGYPSGGLTLVDPPSGQFTSFDMRLDLLRPSTEIGISIGDWIGEMYLDFYDGATLVTSYETSVYSTAAIKYFHLVSGTFDRVDVRASLTSGNWVVPQLAIEGHMATAIEYGDGCYNNRGSFNEFFSPASSFDLAGSSMSMIFNASTQSYTVRPGTTPYVPPSALATTLVLSDDSQTSVSLVSPFPFPGGSTTSLQVCSNGFISLPPGNGVDFSPTLAEFRQFTNMCWASWHDYNPASSGSGQVKYEQVANYSIVTWDGVYGFNDPTPSTVQFQFDRSNGNVHIVWGTMSTGGNAHLVGWKANGIGLPNPTMDLSAALPGTFQAFPDHFGLTMSASSRPVLGTNIALVTDHIPPGGILTASTVSLLATAPVSLAPFGMPGCFGHTDLSVSGSVLLFGGPSVSQLFPIPNTGAFAGVHLFGQSYTLAPGVNATGALSSNGLDLLLDNY